MALFQYEIKQNGQVNTGTITAESSMAASQLLRAKGAFILSLAELHKSEETLLQKLAAFKVELGPSSKDILNFTSQLAVMIKAGISIRAALESIAEQIENKKFRRILEQVRQDVEGGKQFSEALSRYPKVFTPLYINMVKASELSGSFAEMLERIVEYLNQQMETRAMVRGAMIYPIIIGVMAVSTTVFLLTFVLPKFVVIFQGKEALLPVPTKIILGLSAALRGYWYLFIGGTVGLFTAFYWYVHTNLGRVQWDILKLKMPILKKVFRSLYISRSMQTMGELVNAGVPILESLKITSDISGNTIYRNMWKDVAHAVKEGKKITSAMKRNNLLPQSVVQMLRSGEESGKLSEVLRDISAFYQRELKNVIRMVTAMIEPLMIVAMGFVVGFIAMSIILPIFKMSSLVKSM